MSDEIISIDRKQLELIRVFMAEAWDEGWENGAEDERMDYERTPNPYRDMDHPPGKRGAE